MKTIKLIFYEALCFSLVDIIRRAELQSAVLGRETHPSKVFCIEMEFYMTIWIEKPWTQKLKSFFYINKTKFCFKKPFLSLLYSPEVLALRCERVEYGWNIDVSEELTKIYTKQIYWKMLFTH